MQLDEFDRKLLAHLQEDARLTNNELSERIHLSPSQCSRRRIRLEGKQQEEERAHGRRMGSAALPAPQRTGFRSDYPCRMHPRST